MEHLESEKLEMVIAQSETWFRVTAVETAVKGSTVRRYNLALEGDVLLVGAEFDSVRTKPLVELLTDTADVLERRLTGLDLTLADVKPTLVEDHRHDR